MFSFISLLGGIIAGKRDGNLKLLPVFYFNFILGVAVLLLVLGGVERLQVLNAAV